MLARDLLNSPAAQLSSVCIIALLAGCADQVSIRESSPESGSVAAAVQADPNDDVPADGEPSSETASMPPASDAAATAEATQNNASESEPAPTEPASAEPIAGPAPTTPEATTPTAANESSTTSSASEPKRTAAPNLAAEIDAFEVPPKWLADVTTEWDVSATPWEDGRVEIRRLLGTNDESDRREALKLMWDYKLKQDMGNGHEYGMYTFLGKEPVWAVIAFRDELNHPDSHFKYPPYFAAQGLASILAKYNEFEEAEALLKRAATWTPPPPSGRFAKPNTSWTEVRQAESHDALGDLYLAWGKTDEALKHFREAVRIYPTGKPPYGKHLLPRKAKKIQAKIDLVEGGSLSEASLKDGTYRANAIGYSGDVKLTVRVEGNRVVEIDIDHQEKIDQGATKTVPDRIIAQQSLNVDGVTGATVTKDAIISGMLEALRKAGL